MFDQELRERGYKGKKEKQEELSDLTEKEKEASSSAP